MAKEIDWYIDETHVLRLKQYYVEDIYMVVNDYFNCFFTKEVVDSLYYEMYRKTKIRKRYILNGILYYLIKHIIDRVVKGKCFIFPDGQTKMYIGKTEGKLKEHYKGTTSNKIKSNVLKDKNYKIFIKNPNFKYEYYIKLSEYYNKQVGVNKIKGVYGS